MSINYKIDFVTTLVLILFISSISFWGFESWMQDRNSYFSLYEVVSSKFWFQIPTEPVISILFFIFPGGMSLKVFSFVFYLTTVLSLLLFAKRAFDLCESENKKLFCIFAFLMLSNRLVLDNILTPTRFSLALIFFLIALVSGKTKVYWMILSIATHNLAGLFGCIVYLTHKWVLLLRLSNVFLFILITLVFLFTIWMDIILYVGLVPRFDRILTKIDFGLSTEQYFQVIFFLIIPWVFVFFNKAKIDLSNVLLRVSFLSFVILVYFSYVTGFFLRISLLAAIGPYIFLPIRSKILLGGLQAFIVPASYYWIYA